MVKGAGELIVQIGVGKIVWNIIDATTPVGTGKFAKICVTVGGAVLVNMTTNAAVAHVEQGANRFVAGLKKSMIKTEEEAS